MLDPNSKPILAGILFYLNELEPSKDLLLLKQETLNNQTDVVPEGQDKKAVANWISKQSLPQLSGIYREERSIRVIPCDKKTIEKSLVEFDNIVNEIECCVLSEVAGNTIKKSWKTFPDERNCTACDFKTYCPKPAPRKYTPTAP